MTTNNTQQAKQGTKMKDSKDNINNFGHELEQFSGRFEEKLGVQNQVNILICQAVSMACSCAPTELTGMKTIMQALENGILQYEHRFQEKDQNLRVKKLRAEKEEKNKKFSKKGKKNERS